MSQESAKVYPTEYEIKLDLGSRENYSKLMEELGTPLDIYNQKNYFLDTEERILLKSHWAFRVRIVAASEVPGMLRHSYAEITLKGPETGKGDVSERYELNDPVPVVAAMSLVECGCEDLLPSVNTIIELRKRIDDRKLHPLLAFRNTRSIFDRMRDCGCSFEVDMTDFGNGVFGYELEVEFDEPGSEVIERTIAYVRRLFQDLNILYIVQKNSKFATALKNHSLLQ